MKSYSSKLAVHNMTDGPRVIWVEPWGGDFTLLPNEEIEIVANNTLALPWFSLIEHQQCTQVYIQVPDVTSTGYAVMQGGNQLLVGHNRRAAQEAGIEL
jgi:hypothetical protein